MRHAMADRTDHQ